MQHVDSLLVDRQNVGPVLDQHADQIHVAVESREMQRREAIVSLAARVYPGFQELLALGSQPLLVQSAAACLSTAAVHLGFGVLILVENELDEDFTGFLNVFVGSVVYWRVPAVVVYICHVELLLCRVQVILQLFKVHALNKLENQFFFSSLLD